MSTMPGITNANQALAAEDLEGDLFKVAAGKITGKTITEVDPGNPALVSAPPASTPPASVLRADGSWSVIPAATPETIVWGTGTHSLTLGSTGSTAIVPIYVGNSNAGLVPAAPVAPLSNKFLQADGTWQEVIIPAPTNALTYDVIGKTLTSTVSGVVSTTSLASLDDEGVSLAFSAGNLQLKNAAGTVLSTTPVPDLDAQQLSLSGNTIALTNGGSITLPATTNDITWTKDDYLHSIVDSVDAVVKIPEESLKYVLGYNGDGDPRHQRADEFFALFTPATTVSNTVTGTGAARTISTTVSGVTGAAVAIPDNDAQALSIAGNVISLSNGGSVTLPATTVANALFPGAGGVSALVTIVNGVSSAPLLLPGAAPTTHVNAWTKAGGLAESVNGVASNIAITAAPVGGMTDFIGYNAAGAPVYSPVVRVPRLLEEYKAVAVSSSHAIIGPNLNTLYDEYFISAMIEVTAAGVTYTLPVVPAALNLQKIEVHVKAMGAWTGTVNVAAPPGGTIDGATSYSFNKAAVTGVNASPSRTFKYANSRWFVV